MNDETEKPCVPQGIEVETSVGSWEHLPTGLVSILPSGVLLARYRDQNNRYVNRYYPPGRWIAATSYGAVTRENNDE